MPTNRPFLANFLAAFRAHSAIPSSSASASVSTTTATASSQPRDTHLTTHTTPQPHSTSTPRPITTKAPTNTSGPTTAAVHAAGHLSHTRHPSTSPTSPRNPGSSSSFGNRQRQRRGSDSSSEGGFRDALGGEKWYIGGRTAQGEERFYRLGMVKRERSGDRLSLDRLSL